LNEACSLIYSFLHLVTQARKCAFLTLIVTWNVFEDLLVWNYKVLEFSQDLPVSFEVILIDFRLLDLELSRGNLFRGLVKVLKLFFVDLFVLFVFYFFKDAHKVMLMQIRVTDLINDGFASELNVTNYRIQFHSYIRKVLINTLLYRTAIRLVGVVKCKLFNDTLYLLLI
jgi:hypothetical protein